jgi:hypothetical protein
MAFTSANLRKKRRMLPYKKVILSTEKGNGGCADTTPQRPKGAPCMLTLSRKQMIVIFFVLVSFIIALVASMAVLHNVNPDLWQHVDGVLPNIISHY